MLAVVGGTTAGSVGLACRELLQGACHAHTSTASGPMGENNSLSADNGSRETFKVANQLIVGPNVEADPEALAISRSICSRLCSARKRVSSSAVA